jgi:hypothetical protein
MLSGVAGVSRGRECVEFALFLLSLNFMTGLTAAHAISVFNVDV